jgi:hypothetical protein
VNKEVLISGSKDEAAAELKRIFAQPVLAMSTSLGALARAEVVAAQHVEQGSLAQRHGAVGLPLLVHQQRKLDPGLFLEVPGVTRITQADSDKFCAFFLKCLFVFAQLRDVLSAEDSAPVAEENYDRRTVRPQ